MTANALTVICAWCPGFDRTDPRNHGASHGLCPTCAAKIARLLDREPPTPEPERTV